MHEQLNLLNADLDAIIDAIAAEPQPQEQADEAAPRPKYYHIDENTARRAHEMMSMRDYPENRATNEYRAAVDKASALVETKKKNQRLQPQRSKLPQRFGMRCGQLSHKKEEPSERP